MELSTSNFLDYANMPKLPEETYRSFYNRLVGFIRQHLPTEIIEVEGVVVPATGETLTVALLDTVAIHWMLNIDRRLVNIVKTEFATELKTKRLCQLVKQIAANVDDLLMRYDSKDQISLVKADSVGHGQGHDSYDIPAFIRRVEKLESKPYSNNNYRRRQKNSKSKSQQQCSHCVFLNKQLGSTLDKRHESTACGKRSVSISLLNSLDICEESNPSYGNSSFHFTESEAWLSL